MTYALGHPLPLISYARVLIENQTALPHLQSLSAASGDQLHEERASGGIVAGLSSTACLRGCRGEIPWVVVGFYRLVHSV